MMSWQQSDQFNGYCIFIKVQSLQKVKVSNQSAEKSKSKVTFRHTTTQILNTMVYNGTDFQ
ncbi:hypothetical protein AWE51_10440 [Aquimarina aggregata]|uniref:Uncharacterized protein n=1 Tax=Aquimarina aggregata TaxID=1642818 RepID=A0A162Y7W1_9FLAO|nr:hypothetical protein AWE51_10440 [Aquimarina aggregata]